MSLYSSLGIFFFYFFPNNPFSKKIECKFGAFCQRPNCAYMHPKMPTFQPPMYKKPFPKDKKPNPALNKKNGIFFFFFSNFFFFFRGSHFKHNKRDQDEVK